MARGTSQSQSSSSSTSCPGFVAGMAPHSSALATAGMRRRRLSSFSAGFGGGGIGSNVLKSTTSLGSKEKFESESEEDILDEGDEEIDEEHDQEPEVPVQPEPVVNKAPEVSSAPKEATKENFF